MDLYFAIDHRTSVRVYKTDPVPKAKVRRLLEAATRAPSWANKQCWRFIVVDDPAVRAKIGELTALRHMAGPLANAPYTIVLCADPRASGESNGMEFFLFDCAAAMQNLILGAVTEGLGTCVISAFDESALRSLLGVPAEIRIVALTPLGYPATKDRPTERQQMAKVVSVNQWGKSDPMLVG